jgi:hypothetical protein
MNSNITEIASRLMRQIGNKFDKILPSQKLPLSNLDFAARAQEDLFDLFHLLYLGQGIIKASKEILDLGLREQCNLNCALG